jgi:hypothetical protein
MIEGGDELAHAATIGSNGAAAELTPAAGERIGRFVVQQPLGQGGMGLVVSAMDPELDRVVALKLVPTQGSGGSTLSERLLREARAMARLRHDNVLTVYEAGTHEGWVYVAMELVRGGTLRDAGARTWRETVALFARAGAGLAAAHARGLVHRDFKPENVLLEDDRVLVADFGLVSHAVDAPTGSGPAETPLPSSPLTQIGEVVGTPLYMAPEQHAGGRVDARSDQFSFCVALYEALPGGGAGVLHPSAARAGRARLQPPGSPDRRRRDLRGAGAARRRPAGRFSGLGGGALAPVHHVLLRLGCRRLAGPPADRGRGGLRAWIRRERGAL